MVGRLGAAQTTRVTPVVMQGGPTAEEKKKDALEKAAACRNMTEADRWFREQAAVGLEAAKRVRLDGKEDIGGATSGMGQRPGRVKQVLPGPPYVYTMYAMKVEAVVSAAVEQLRKRGVRYRRRQIVRLRRIQLQWQG